MKLFCQIDIYVLKMSLTSMRLGMKPRQDEERPDHSRLLEVSRRPGPQVPLLRLLPSVLQTGFSVVSQAEGLTAEMWRIVFLFCLSSTLFLSASPSVLSPFLFLNLPISLLLLAVPSSFPPGLAKSKHNQAEPLNPTNRQGFSEQLGWLLC